MPTESFHRGVESEAAMLWGPTADPEAWRHRAMSAMMGRVPDAYLADCRDEQHPDFVLGGWEQEYRDALDQPTDLAATLPRVVDYLDRQLHVVATLEDPAFEDFARDVRGLRAHLEDVLHDGVREEQGAPCPACGEADLVLRHGEAVDGSDDRWTCPRRACGQSWTEHDYRAKVAGTYVQVADRLTASQIRETYRVLEGTVRQWASRGQVAKRGKDPQGRQLYDVGEVLTMRDQREERDSPVRAG